MIYKNKVKIKLKIKVLIHMQLFEYSWRLFGKVETSQTLVDTYALSIGNSRGQQFLGILAPGSFA